MKNISIYTLIGTFLLILFWGLSSQAGILSQSYRVPAYVLNGGGLQGASENFLQVASLGESTPTGFSQSEQFKNYAGFIPQINIIPQPLEICDGIDNDGDGQVDEDLVQDCSNECGPGTKTCVNGQWLNCTAPTPPCDEEICDGIDNDGDGQVDEDLVQDCSNECGPGTETCVNGQWLNCTAPTPPCPGCNATRSSPGYAPGSSVTITIKVNPDIQTATYAVEDTPPYGWQVSDISDDGTWDSVNRKVKWRPFYDNNPRTLTYNITAPSGANGCYPISGSASFDGINQSICGDIEICPGFPHPADTNDDWCLTINEITGYGAAWMNGEEWPVAPNPIPIDYLTRAGYIWMGGECYDYTPEFSPPLCWDLANTQPAARRRAMSETQTLNHSFDPDSYVPGQPVTVVIEVIPDPSTVSYALEDMPPGGWTVSDISDDGTWDSVNQKVKWKPFFDNQQRTFTYKATPPPGESGTKGFHCVFSANGTNYNIDRQITDIPPCVEEICDGKDNDCDDEIDEDLTRATTCGVGECAGNTGIETCNAGIWIGDTCDPSAGSIPEICDTLDNDCDGQADEDLVQDCSNECGPGTEICENGEWVNCMAPPVSKEICDSVDNDCDGQVDEGLDRACTTESGPGIEICENGEWGNCTPIDCNAIRSAPGYAPGSSLTITIDVIPDAQTVSYDVEDTPPDGWQVSDISDDGTWDSVNKKVEWGPFFDNASRTLTYNIEVPSDANGCYLLSGYASFDAVNQSICGDVEICDNNAFEMNLSAGWSMISLPMIPDNATLSAVFPEAVVMYMFEMGFGYVRVNSDDDLEAGRGYWILLNEAESYSIKGQRIQEYILSVPEAGWEMIGGCVSPAQASADHCNIVVIYSFDNQTGYRRIPEGELFEPCKGYWILFSDTTGDSEFMVTTQF